MRCQGLRWRTSHLPRPDGRLPPYIPGVAAVAHKARQKIAAGEPVWLWADAIGVMVPCAPVLGFSHGTAVS